MKDKRCFLYCSCLILFDLLYLFYTLTFIFSRIQIVISHQSRHPAWVSMDGRHRQKVYTGGRISITSSPWPVPTVSAENQSADWFSSLAQCLNWNHRILQKAFTAPPSQSRSSVVGQQEGGLTMSVTKSMRNSKTDESK